MKNGRVELDNRTVWFLNDQRHREDGPAIEFHSGTQEWFLNDQRHRIDGPAVIDIDGDKAWYQNGNLHREDGPAIEWDNGTNEWHLNGQQVTEEEFEHWKVKNDLNKSLHENLAPKLKTKGLKI